MKFLLSIALIFLIFSGLSWADDNGTKPEEKTRIGVYDSRIISYAQFWSDSHQKKMSELYNKAKTAKKAEDKKTYEELDKLLWADRKRSHRQVFSTAPIDDVLELIKDRLPEIQKEAGVSALVSKWDEKKLAEYKSAEKVDVTDLLANEFKFPQTEKHLKTIEAMKKVQPVPLNQIDKMKCD